MKPERIYDSEQLRMLEAQKASADCSPASCCASVLDVCCGSRMFWFDRKNPHALFVDKRRETHEMSDAWRNGGSKQLVIDPDIVADFTDLPFKDNRFSLVVYDPPHLIRKEALGVFTKKYGVLNGDWKEMLRKGFVECFRVLKPNGTLIFKWSESNVPVSQITALTPHKPLFGNRCGKTAKSHWIVYMKHNAPHKPPATDDEQ